MPSKYNLGEAEINSALLLSRNFRHEVEFFYAL